MGSINRCLIHGHKPDRVVEVAKEIVARGAELLAAGGTAEVLRGAGVPVTGLPTFTATSKAPHGAFQLLHPRLHGGLLGNWDDREQQEELERQGVKRIDLVIVELPTTEGEPGGPELLEQLEIGAVAVLRSAARAHGWITTICDLSDVTLVTAELDSGAVQVSPDLRLKLARKALQTVARYDAVLASRSGTSDEVFDTWSLQVERLASAPMAGSEGERVGLFHQPHDIDREPSLEVLSGKPLTTALMLDADLAWSVVSDLDSPAVAITHCAGLCGFAKVRDGGFGSAFADAKAVDPRGSFGGVVAFNREVDDSCVEPLSKAVLQAVLAPAFSAEVRAGLGKTKTRLVRVTETSRSMPICVSTRWGLLLRWLEPAGIRSAEYRTVSTRQPDPMEQEDLALAWALVNQLRPTALVIVAGGRLLSAGAAQTSWRDAARMALMKLPAGTGPAVAASGNPIRFADDLVRLSEAGIRAVLHPSGSPREAEVTERANQLDLAVQVVESLEAV